MADNTDLTNLSDVFEENDFASLLEQSTSQMKNDCQNENQVLILERLKIMEERYFQYLADVYHLQRLHAFMA